MELLCTLSCSISIELIVFVCFRYVLVNVLFFNIFSIDRTCVVKVSCMFIRLVSVRVMFVRFSAMGIVSVGFFSSWSLGSILVYV